MAGTGSWAGVDLGTSSVKALLIDATETPLAATEVPLEVSRPAPGWSEQAPDDWWEAALLALDRLAAAAPEAMRGLRGIGLSGQMHGAVLLDRADRVLRPAILWNDGRAAAECAALEARADFRGIAGNLVMPGFTAPKLEWVRRHEPDVFAEVATVLLPKDYLRLRLTGERLSDMSDASGTLWLDVAGRDWSDALLGAGGLGRERMPGLVEGSAPAGRLRDALRSRWGVQGQVTVAGGAGDNAAAACGAGVVRPGEAFLSVGTSGVLFVVTHGFRPNPARAVHAFAHAVPGVWHQMGVILAAADSLSWLARLTGRSAADLAAEAPAGRPGPVFLPYLSGERTPLNAPGARAALIGLAAGDGPAEIARAVMEGVALAFADAADALAEAGMRPSEALALGGGARSAAWLQWIADATGIALAESAAPAAGAALGAARLARAAAEGGEGAEIAELCPPAPVAARIEPTPAGRARMAEARARYLAQRPLAAGQA